ncbi:MAG: polysaccharide deacetylase family protein, partial [Burkholderiales bacterium]
MLKVFFTVDVEVWCDGWYDLDRAFPDAFHRYVYGPTAHGNCALPLTLRILSDHGLSGVFFTEPLFAARFGIVPLQEIVGLIAEAGQEVQMHLHTEWADEARAPLLPGVSEKRQHLRSFSRNEQTELIRIGLDLLRSAGVEGINAFRAGNFGANRDTLCALEDNAISFDSSYNPCVPSTQSMLESQEKLFQPARVNGVIEYPMTVFAIGSGKFRHAQLGACSFREMERLLWQASDAGWRSFVILAHNFELLNKSKTARDDIVVNRFEELCGFLDRNRDVFHTSGFRNLTPDVFDEQPPPLKSALLPAFLRA